jgi:hypothetical protein
MGFSVATGRKGTLCAKERARRCPRPGPCASALPAGRCLEMYVERRPSLLAESPRCTRVGILSDRPLSFQTRDFVGSFSIIASSNKHARNSENDRKRQNRKICNCRLAETRIVKMRNFGLVEHARAQYQQRSRASLFTPLCQDSPIQKHGDVLPEGSEFRLFAKSAPVPASSEHCCVAPRRRQSGGARCNPLPHRPLPCARRPTKGGDRARAFSASCEGSLDKRKGAPAGAVVGASSS